MILKIAVSIIIYLVCMILFILAKDDDKKSGISMKAYLISSSGWSILITILIYNLIW